MPASAKLAELGIDLPPVTAPLAAYVPALIVGDLVYVSGQLPMVEGAPMATGKVGAEVSGEQAAMAARQCALAGLAVVDSAVGIDAVRQVVKLTGFVAAAPGFTSVPQVVNGASDVMGEVFGDAGAHARSAVGVAELPLGAPVEVEFIFAVNT